MSYKESDEVTNRNLLVMNYYHMKTLECKKEFAKIVIFFDLRAFRRKKFRD